MTYKNSVTKNKQQKETIAENTTLGRRSAVCSVVLLVAAILLIIFELFVSAGTLEYGHHLATGNTGFLEGIIVMFYLFPIMFTGFVFAILSFLALVHLKNIRYAENSSKVIARYIFYAWSQIAMLVPIAFMMLIFQNQGMTVPTVTFLAISSIICSVSNLFMPFLIAKHLKINAKTIRTLSIVLFIIAVIVAILWFLSAEYHIFY